MVKVRAVIFDVDGTLIDSVGPHAAAWARAFEAHGFHFPYAEVRHQIGKGGDQLLPHFLTADEIARLGNDLEAAQGEIFRRDYMDGLKPFPGVRALFERLHAEGIACVLGSSGKADEVRRKAEIAGIADLVDAMTTADDAERSKPCPDIFQAAVSRMAPIPAAEALVIGDTPYDAGAAVAAGVRPIGVLSGGFPERELTDAGCIAVYRDVADLLDRIDSSPILT